MTPARRLLARSPLHPNSAERAFADSCQALPARHREAFQRYVQLLRKRKANEVVVLAQFTPSEEPVAFAYDPLARRSRHAQLVEPLRPVREGDAGAEMRRQFEAIRNRILDDGLSTPEVSQRLRITGEAIRQRVERKELFALKLGRDYRFPEWQFDPRSTNGVVRGIREVLKVTVLHPLELAVWFQRGMTALSGQSPIEALRAGNLRDVVAAAEAAGVM